MNVDMTKVEELIAERDAFNEAYNTASAMRDEQYEKYINAKYVWEENIRQTVINAIMDETDENMDIRFNSWDDYEVGIEYGRYSDVALKWDYTITYNPDTKEVTYRSNSWSGADITTPEKIANLEYSVNIMKKIIAIDWEEIFATFDNNRPNIKEYVTTKVPTEGRKDWDKEIFFATIDAYKDANVLFQGVDETGWDVWYKIIKETPKRYTVVVCNRTDVEVGKKDGTLKEYIDAKYNSYGISKDKFYDRVYDKKAVLGVEMIEY
jgi:hypothetical protein